MDAALPAYGARGRRSALIKLGAYAGFILALVGAAAVTGSLPSVDDVRDLGDGLSGVETLLFVPLFVGLNFVVAWAILTGAAGLLFGTAAGAALALAGVTAAALVQMVISRRLAGEHAGELLPRWAAPVERLLERSGTLAVIECRLMPLLPYGAVNYCAGLTRLRFRDMALGTAIGAAPKVWAYAALGGSLTDLRAPEAKIAVVLIVLLAVGGLLLARRQLAVERGRAA
jgi:uncharacterized membrane protein YdjX (TVP38/TMEM64 family)